MITNDFIIGVFIGIAIGQIPILVLIYCKVKGIKTRLDRT